MNLEDNIKVNFAREWSPGPRENPTPEAPAATLIGKVTNHPRPFLFWVNVGGHLVPKTQTTDESSRPNASSRTCRDMSPSRKAVGSTAAELRRIAVVEYIQYIFI